MITITTVARLRDACERARCGGARVGLVPTMGYLHAGHRSLMRTAQRETDFVVVTSFVNPLQFGTGEDVDSYPRDLAGDTAAAEAERVDVLFVPSVAEMYPEPTATTVHVSGLTEGLCGAARPTHFDGVTTVVAKLLAIVGPCRAYFGCKDFQQLAVVRRMTADLGLPVEIVGCPIVREPDGLAMSSRNAHLGDEDRRAAAVLSRALHWAAESVVRGERDAAAVLATVRSVVAGEPLVALEYAEVRSAADLRPLDVLDGEVLVALAARLGAARLIDNVVLTVHGDDVATDLGVVVFTPEESEASACVA